jgi:hypothetical protein
LSAPIDAKIAFWVAVALIVVSVAIDVGVVAFALSPLFVGALLYAAFRSPIQHSLLVLMFLAMTVENPNEAFAAGMYSTPWSMIGVIFFLHLKSTIGVPFLFLSPLEYAIYFLLILAVWRKSQGVREPGFRLALPQPIKNWAWVSLATSGLMALYGLSRGGDFGYTLWQLDRVVYLPILVFLFAYAISGPGDIVRIGKVFLVASVYRALLAAYVRHTVEAPLDVDGESTLAHATSHHDSMLFAAGALVLLLPIVERVRKGAWKPALLLMPILIEGMIANDRRMVYVQVGLVFVTLYFITPPNPMKKKIRRLAIGMAPFFAAYLAAGWNTSGKGPWKLAGTVRSVVEPGTDQSSLWREIENYDLLTTFRQAPFLGSGYGHPFWEVIPLPAVPFPLENYCPHNSILGIWAFGGVVGFTGLTMLWTVGVYYAMRAYLSAGHALERCAAIFAMGSVLIYMVQCFGDMGLGSWTGVFLMSSSIVMAGKLARNAERLAAAEAGKASTPAST